MRHPSALTRPKVSGGSALVLALSLLPLGACSGDDGTTLTVLAAASLTEPFEELADRFEAGHPGVEVRLAFDSSATLAQQAVEGAPADVLATADEDAMDDALPAVSGEPRVFTSNALVLAAPADNPAGVTGIEDLQRPDVTWVACVETAPCGRLARTLLDLNGIDSEPASLEVDVKAVLAKVTSDEADAGLVYESDVVAAGDAVDRFVIPGTTRHWTTYPIATLEQSAHPSLARAFVDLVLSAEGQDVLDEAGFTPALTADGP